MAQYCEFCKRGSLKSASRSHSNIKTLRRQHINLQRKWLGGKSRMVCTRCIKTMKKQEVLVGAQKKAGA